MIPGQGTKIPHAPPPKKKKNLKKKKRRSNTVTNSINTLKMIHIKKKVLKKKKLERLVSQALNFRHTYLATPASSFLFQPT